MSDDPRDRPPKGARGGARAPALDVAPKPREPHIPPGGLPFGRYALLRRISYGGMGEIFLAKQHGLGSFKKLLVIKRLLSHYRSDADIVKMFFDEAKLQSTMSDRGIVQIWDMGEVDDHYFIAMEYVQGQSWRRLIERLKERGEHIHPAHAVDLAVQVCRGLSYAHNLVDGNGRPLNVVHRDINPQNVLLSYDGECKIIDFGIAKSALSGVHTEEGTIKGKFAYMAPEQARAEPLDRRSDLFAFGICLYELLTTKNPFYRKNVVLSLEAICEKQVPPLEEVRPAVAAVSPVVDRCLMKNPDERFADMSEVAEALTGLYSDGLLGDPPVSLSDWLHDVFEAEIDEQAQFLLANGFSSITLKRPQTNSDANRVSPYGVGAEISTRKTRAVSEESLSYELPPEPPTEAPSQGDTHPTATLALDVEIVSRPDNIMPETTAERAAAVEVPGEFSEDTLVPQDGEGRPRAAGGCMLFTIAILTAVLGAVGAFYVFLVWDQPDRSPEAALARLDTLLAGEDDASLWPQDPPPTEDPTPGTDKDVPTGPAVAAADAGAATPDPPDEDTPDTPPVVDEDEGTKAAGADAGPVVLAKNDDPPPGDPPSDEPDAATATTAETPTDDGQGRRARGDRRRGRRGQATSQTGGDGETSTKPEPKEAAEVAGVVTVNAGGPFRIVGGGVRAKNVARVRLFAGKAKTISIKGAPLAVKLRLEDNDGVLSVRVGAEPWAIVRVNNLGKGRTPLSLSTKQGGRLLIELKSPKAGDMRLTLGYAGP